MSDTSTLRTADFLNTLGVQTHIEYLDGGYAQIGTVAAELKRLGIRHIRDGISDGPNGAAPLSSYIALAKQGFTFTILAPDASVVDTASLNARLALVQRLVEAVPGCVTSIEGANEVNNWPVTFNGVGGLNGAIAMQKALYAAVHGNPALAGITVDYFTGYAAMRPAVSGSGPTPRPRPAWRTPTPSIPTRTSARRRATGSILRLPPPTSRARRAGSSTRRRATARTGERTAASIRPSRPATRSTCCSMR